MEIKLKPILIEQKSVFIQLMELYNYEFSEYEDSDINEYGYYGIYKKDFQKSLKIVMATLFILLRKRSIYEH
jgi:hypothetical protein